MTNEHQGRRRDGLAGDQASWPRAFFQRIVPAGESARPTGPGAAAGPAQQSQPAPFDAANEQQQHQIEDESAGDAAGESVAETVELTGVYIISVAARLLEMHPQTLRKYERFGFIRPSRTAGALRLYSDQDLARLRIVRRLAEELGLNLAGVRLLLEVISQLENAIRAIEEDEASRQSPGARAAITHLHAVLDFVNA